MPCWAAGGVPQPALDEDISPIIVSRTVTLGGGDFRSMQVVFQHVKGVKRVVAGYTGGDPDSAHFDAVQTGYTDHVEVVRITYDPSQRTLGDLLHIFMSVAHDPTELDRQGEDKGRHFRSSMFYANEQQKKIMESYITQLSRIRPFPLPVVTKLEPFYNFYPAEDLFQDYSTLHRDDPVIVKRDGPKVKALAQLFPSLYQEKPVLIRDVGLLDPDDLPVLSSPQKAP